MSRVTQAHDARNGHETRQAAYRAYRPTIKVPAHLQGTLADAARDWGRTPAQMLQALVLTGLDRLAMRG